MRLPKNFQPVGVSKSGRPKAAATRSTAPLVGIERATALSPPSCAGKVRVRGRGRVRVRVRVRVSVRDRVSVRVRVRASVRVMARVRFGLGLG